MLRKLSYIFLISCGLFHMAASNCTGTTYNPFDPESLWFGNFCCNDPVHVDCTNAGIDTGINNPNPSFDLTEYQESALKNVEMWYTNDYVQALKLTFTAPGTCIENTQTYGTIPATVTNY